MATVYILYSKTIDTFYIGSCKDFELRLKQHQQNLFEGSFTKRAEDWYCFFKIDNLGYQQARSVENHIKRMKSRKYILNLDKYPEIGFKLIQKYA